MQHREKQKHRATPRNTVQRREDRETPCNAEKIEKHRAMQRRSRNTVQRREDRETPCNAEMRNTVQHEIRGTCIAVQRRSERFARLKVTQESNGCCAVKHRQHVRFERSATQKLERCATGKSATNTNVFHTALYYCINTYRSRGDIVRYHPLKHCPEVRSSPKVPERPIKTQNKRGAEH